MLEKDILGLSISYLLPQRLYYDDLPLALFVDTLDTWWANQWWAYLSTEPHSFALSLAGTDNKYYYVGIAMPLLMSAKIH